MVNTGTADDLEVFLIGQGNTTQTSLCLANSLGTLSKSTQSYWLTKGKCSIRTHVRVTVIITTV